MELQIVAENAIPQILVTMAELNFLEYNVNTDTHCIDTVSIRLSLLGFKKISVSICGSASMWSMNHCLMLVNTDSSVKTGLSGIGLNSDKSFDDSKHCNITGLGKHKYQNLNLYTFPVDQFRKNYDAHFKSLPFTNSEIPIDYFAGMIVSNNNVNFMNTFNTVLQMRTVKKSTAYVTSVCQNNRFNVMWDNSASDVSIDTVVLKTDNIFDVVAEYASIGFSFSKVDTSRIDKFYNKYVNDEYFLNLPKKNEVKAYNLNIAGKPKSYVIEKNIVDALPNLNFIISQRFNHNGLNEESVQYYTPGDRDANPTNIIPAE